MMKTLIRKKYLPDVHSSFGVNSMIRYPQEDTTWY